MSGRYYAMDRDKRWERVKLTMTQSRIAKDHNSAHKLLSKIAKDVTDEFVIPSVIVKDGKPVAKS